MLQCYGLKFTIYNIGFGAAKFVEYEWELNLKKFYDVLVSANTSGAFNLEYNKDKFVDKAERIYIRTDKDEYLTSFTRSKESEKSQFDFLNSNSIWQK